MEAELQPALSEGLLRGVGCQADAGLPRAPQAHRHPAAEPRGGSYSKTQPWWLEVLSLAIDWLVTLSLIFPLPL